MSKKLIIIIPLNNELLTMENGDCFSFSSKTKNGKRRRIMETDIGDEKRILETGKIPLPISVSKVRN